MLCAEDHAIRLEEQTMAAFNSSHLTQGEQNALNQQENAVSKLTPGYFTKDRDGGRCSAKASTLSLARG